jgi:hypothetical protein
LSDFYIGFVLVAGALFSYLLLLLFCLDLNSLQPLHQPINYSFYTANGAVSLAISLV